MVSKKLFRNGWLMWLLAAVFYGLDYFQHTAPSVLLKPISESTGLSIIHVGNIMSIYFPIYAITQLPAGLLLDKFGSRKVLPLACALVSVGLMITATGFNDISLVLGRVLIAIGSAFAFLGALKVASDWLSSQVFPVAVGLTNSVGVLGGMFGQVLLNILITHLQWQEALWCIGLFGIVLAFMLVLFLRDNPSITESVNKQNVVLSDVKILLSGRLWLLAIYAAIMVGTVVNAFSEMYDVVFLEYAYHLNAQQASQISSMIFVGIAVGGPLHSVIARKIFGSKKRWMITANVLTIVIFGLIANFYKLIPEMLLSELYFMLGFCVSSMLLAFAIAKDIFPETAHGITMAFINTMIGISGAVFQPLVGQLFEYVNGGLETIANPNTFSIGFLGLLLPLLISLLCCIFITSHSNK